MNLQSAMKAHGAIEVDIMSEDEFISAVIKFRREMGEERSLLAANRNVQANKLDGIDRIKLVTLVDSWYELADNFLKSE